MSKQFYVSGGVPLNRQDRLLVPTTPTMTVPLRYFQRSLKVISLQSVISALPVLALGITDVHAEVPGPLCV